MRLAPSSSHLPSPTARTLPRCGFSLAVSGRTIPLAVVSSSSIGKTISRFPRGLSFIEILRKKSLGTLRQRVPNVVWHSSKGSARRLVLVRRLWRHARGDLRRPGHDLREADHGDRVVVADRAAVDLLQEVDLLVQAAELGVVVLDVAWREVAYALDLDRVDD